jgi:predicted HicB family RNase H-like nuclease
MNDIEKRFNAVETVKPDEWDLQMIASIEKANDTSEGVTLAELDRIRAAQDYSGKISLRLPKTLHRDLSQAAKQEGISLNQFILYKLAQ